MRRAAFAAALIGALAAAGPASAQFQPGLRAPANVREGVVQSFLMGCFFAVTGRPANGLNMALTTDGASLHAPTGAVPEIINVLGAQAESTRMVVLDTPEGAVWTLFQPATGSCRIVPERADAQGVEAALSSAVDAWRTVSRAGGGAAYEFAYDAMPFTGVPAGRARAHYQPSAGPASPQMIVVERVAR